MINNLKFWTKNLRKNLVFEVILIIILGLTPLLWYKEGYWIYGVDIDFPPNPITIFLRRKFAWNDVFLGGTDRSMEISTGLVYMGSQAILNYFGFGIAVGQILIFVFWFSLVGLSMYYFMHTLFSTENIEHGIIRISATIFYMFNFYQVFLWDTFRTAQIFVVFLAPVFLGLFIKTARKGKITKGMPLKLFIVCLLASGIGTHPPSLAAFLLLAFSYMCYHIIVNNSESRVKLLKIMCVFLIIFIGANIYWIIPQINYIIQSGYTNSQTTSVIFDSSKLLGITSAQSSFLNVIRLYGHPFWFDSWGGVMYNPWFAEYQTNIYLIISSFLLPSLVLTSILVYRDKNTFFFAVFITVIIFLVKGVHPPFGNIYLWIVTNIPGFWIFRAPWSHFFVIGIFGYAYLAGISVGKIYSIVKKYLNTIQDNIKISSIIPLFIVFLIILNVLAYNYAFIFGKMLPSSQDDDIGYSQKFNVGVYQKVPQYVFDSASWINQKKGDFKVLLLPEDKTNVYNWGYASPHDITFDIFNKGVLFRQYGEGTASPHPIDDMIGYSYNLLYNNQTQLSNIFALMNVKYLMQRNDFKYNFYGDSDSPEFIKSKLAIQKDIKLEKSFGEWDIYEINQSIPHIFATPYLIYLDGEIDSMISFAGNENFNPKGAIYVSKINSHSMHDFAMNFSLQAIQENRSEIFLTVFNGKENIIDWPEVRIEPKARYYEGWKEVINTDGNKDDIKLTFETYEKVPYIFYSETSGFSAYNSTLVYLVTGDEPMEIYNIYADNELTHDIIGIWWENGWIGMSTKSISYPVFIPANQRVIIQIGKKTNHVKLDLGSNIQKVEYFDFDDYIADSHKINPTQYLIEVNSSEPFVLVFSEPYNPQWKIYDGSISWIETLWTKPIEDDKHFIVNGYSNGWFINKTGEFEFSLYYFPQTYVYLGFILTGMSFVGCIGYFIFYWRREHDNSNIKVH